MIQLQVSAAVVWDPQVREVRVVKCGDMPQKGVGEVIFKIFVMIHLVFITVLMCAIYDKI